MGVYNLLICKKTKQALKLPKNVWDAENIKYKKHKKKVRKFRCENPNAEFIYYEDFFEIDLVTGKSICDEYTIKDIYDE